MVSIFLFSCNNDKKVKVKKYRTHNSVVNNDPNDDWIYWYIIYMNNGTFNSYSSTSPVSNYSSIQWTNSKTPPQEINEAEQLESQEINPEDLPEDIQAEVSETNEEPQNDVEGTEESTDIGDAPESSGSDGGDSGGGDSGGGGDF